MIKNLILSFLLLSTMSISDPFGSASFIWQPNTEPDVAGYRIYYGTPPGNFSQITDVGNVTTATITGLIRGSTYLFYATCYNTAGLESDPSDIVEVKISYLRPEAPKNFIAIDNK